jgi:hypothetical protein
MAAALALVALLAIQGPEMTLQMEEALVLEQQSAPKIEKTEPLA